MLFVKQNSRRKKRPGCEIMGRVKKSLQCPIHSRMLVYVIKFYVDKFIFKLIPKKLELFAYFNTYVFRVNLYNRLESLGRNV